VSTYRSQLGHPLFLATHYRQAKCGVHVHQRCWPNGACDVPHVDRFNPDCADEMIPHLAQDFYPAYKHIIDPLVVGVAIGVLAIALLG
jgi:hypothetical protein